MHALILAAGSSSRLGRPKQLVEWQGRPLLQHAIAAAQTLLADRVSVVLGANATAISAHLDLNQVTTLLNPDWQSGMASSIQVGLAALPPSASAVLLMLCDQPLITSLQLHKLLAASAAAPSQIIASAYHEILGVPAVFPAYYFEYLQKLQGDRGAKALFTQFAAQVQAVPLPEAALDIDSVADVWRLEGLCC